MKKYICKEVQTENGGYLEIESELIRCKYCAANDDTVPPCPLIIEPGPEGYCSFAVKRETDRK